MPVSQAPVSIPGKSGSTGPYILGVLVLASLIIGLVWWRSRGNDAPPPPTPVSLNTPPSVQEPVNAPPPPPKIEELDAGAEGGTAKVASTGGGGGKGMCGSGCGSGKSSSALESALRSTAGSAQGCYNRALRSSEVSGSMTVSVQVGANGSVCNASIVNDSVHSNEISTCVLGRFRGRSFPSPAEGCVVVNIPIAFTIKQ